MRTKLLVIVAVTILSVLAAVAIAGIPSSSSTDPDTLVPAPETATEVTSTTTSPPTTVEPPVPDPAAPNTEPPPSEPVTTDAPDATSTTRLERQPVERGLVSIVIINGAAVAGIARETADELREFGYLDVSTTDADIVEATAVFASSGLEAEAERLALDLGVEPSQVFPISSTPGSIDAAGTDLVVYLGVDAGLR